MILVAATAGWLAMARHLGAKTNFRSIWNLSDYGHIRILRDQFGLLLFIVSLALLVIRFRPPRPARRRLWRQPGVAACAGGFLGVAIKALSTAVENHAALRDWNRFDMQVLWGPWPYCGAAVAGAWIALIVTGRWRAERSAIDRLGCLVGACWLVEMLLAEMPWGYILSALIYNATR